MPFRHTEMRQHMRFSVKRHNLDCDRVRFFFSKDEQPFVMCIRPKLLSTFLYWLLEVP